LVYHESEHDSSSTKLVGSLLNAIAVVVAIVIVTVIMVLLYKYRCIKLIIGWLITSSGMLLFIFGGLVSYFIIRAYNFPVDVITFAIVLWNFAAVGVIVIFWYGPQRLNQAYLILISSFMAIFFTQLPEWTTWAILGAIALYDIFAVLCPKGPLKILVELAQERQEPIPALLYNGMVSLATVANKGDLLDEEDRKRGRSVKLGLGDFVFYSVLLGRSSMFDWLTVFTCFVGIITGLFCTLLLLAVFRKALPALPFSIALGFIFFFITKFCLLPFVYALGSVAIFV